MLWKAFEALLFVVSAVAWLWRGAQEGMGKEGMGEEGMGEEGRRAVGMGEEGIRVAGRGISKGRG